MPVVLIGTLDTKGVEVQFVRDLLVQEGIATLVLDAGVLGSPSFVPDVSREQVFAVAGATINKSIVCEKVIWAIGSGLSGA